MTFDPTPRGPRDPDPSRTNMAILAGIALAVIVLLAVVTSIPTQETRTVTNAPTSPPPSTQTR